MKNITVRSEGGYPWETTIFPSGEGGSVKWFVNVNRDSYIWRSFNLKDVMVSTGLLDKDTENAIKQAEGIISGHVIVGLGENKEIKKNQMVVWWQGSEDFPCPSIFFLLMIMRVMAPARFWIALPRKMATSGWCIDPPHWV